MKTYEGENYRFYNVSCLSMPQCQNESVSLTITSPPYWNAIDYSVHTKDNGVSWYRDRDYDAFGVTYDQWLSNIRTVFQEVYRVTIPGGFCAVVIGTILHKGIHYPAPFDVAHQLRESGFCFHQDIIWNKVTGGIRRAGVFIQHPKQGYYYPNIMTEYILIFRKGDSIRRGTQNALPLDDVFKRDIANNIWHIAPIPPRTVNHPCPFPDELVRRLILLYSQEGDEILDPFLGSGQTARGALRLNRKCVGYEIEKQYLELACERLYDEPQRKYQLLPRLEKREINSEQYEFQF